MACRKPSATRNKKQRIYVRDGGKCHYCEIECRPFGVDQKNHHDSATVDHIQTRASGGGNHDNNLVLSCYRCNNLRSCIPYNIFKHEQLWLKENQNRCTKVSRLFALGTMNMTQGKVWLLEMYMDPLDGPITVQNWAMFSNAASVHQYMATKFPEALPNDDDGELGYIGYHFKEGHVLEDVSFVANAWDLQ